MQPLVVSDTPDPADLLGSAGLGVTTIIATCPRTRSFAAAVAAGVLAGPGGRSRHGPGHATIRGSARTLTRRGQRSTASSHRRRTAGPSVPLHRRGDPRTGPGYESHPTTRSGGTFERDKDELRWPGPCRDGDGRPPSNHGRPTGSAGTKHELADPGLSPEELAALHLAATSVRLVGIPVDEVEDALRKLGGTGGGQQRHRSARSTHPTPWPWCSAAVLDHAVITFGHSGDERHPSPTGCSTSRAVVRAATTWTATPPAASDWTGSRVPSPPATPVRSPHPTTSRVRLPAVGARPGTGRDRTYCSSPRWPPSVLAEDPELTVSATQPDGSVVIELGGPQPRRPAQLRAVPPDHAELLDPPGHRRHSPTGWAGSRGCRHESRHQPERASGSCRSCRGSSRSPEPPSSRVCDRFGMTERDLRADLDLPHVRGRHPPVHPPMPAPTPTSRTTGGSRSTSATTSDVRCG